MTLGKRVTRLEDRHGGDPYAGACDGLAALLTKRTRTLGDTGSPLSNTELENFAALEGPPAVLANAILKSKGY